LLKVESKKGVFTVFGVEGIHYFHPKQLCMKFLLTSLFVVAALFSLVAYRNQPVLLSQSDSLAICQDFARHHPEALTAGNPRASANLFAGGLRAQRIVSADSLEQMRLAYVANPVVQFVNTAGAPMTGFILDSNDLPKIAAAAPRLKTIGFHFGIQNFGTFQQAGQKPIYTLILTPYGTNGTPYPPNVLDQNGTAEGFDFVDPCPGSPGCPPPPKQ
jgi:hypothetical protein